MKKTNFNIIHYYLKPKSKHPIIFYIFIRSCNIINYMKATFIIFLLLSNYCLSAQTSILHIPITPADSIKDFSPLNNVISCSWRPMPFNENQHREDSSALYLGLRQWITISTEHLSGVVSGKDMVLSVWFRYTPPGKTQYGSAYSLELSLLFGQKENLGIVFDHSDSSISDYDGLITAKLDSPDTWNHLSLVHKNTDSTVHLLINGQVVASDRINRNVDILPGNERTNTLGLGLYLREYLWGDVDEISITLYDNYQTDLVTSTHIPQTDQSFQTSYYSMEGRLIQENERISGKLYIEKRQNGREVYVRKVVSQ